MRNPKFQAIQGETGDLKESRLEEKEDLPRKPRSPRWALLHQKRQQTESIDMSAINKM